MRTRQQSIVLETPANYLERSIAECSVEVNIFIPRLLVSGKYETFRNQYTVSHTTNTIKLNGSVRVESRIGRGSV